MTRPTYRTIAEAIANVGTYQPERGYVFQDMKGEETTYLFPEVEVETLAIAEVKVDEDRMGAHLVVEGLREGYVHELHLDGVRSAEGGELLHPRAYYTLIRRPKSR